MIKSLSLAALIAIFAAFTYSPEIAAHQVTNASGTATVAHHHVYKRTNYGAGVISGHVAPTRHGNNMIIWSASPERAYGSGSRQMQFSRPSRQRNAPPRRAGQPVDQLRKLNPDSNRR